MCNNWVKLFITIGVFFVSFIIWMITINYNPNILNYKVDFIEKSEKVDINSLSSENLEKVIPLLSKQTDLFNNYSKVESLKDLDSEIVKNIYQEIKENRSIFLYLVKLMDSIIMIVKNYELMK